MLSLFKRQVRVFFQFFVRNYAVTRQRMFSADKYMGTGNKQLVEFQIMGFQQLAEYRFIEIIQKQDSDLAAQTRHIFYDLIGLCLPQAEIVFFLPVLFDQVHECVDGKGIMLGGYAELFFAPGISLVFILKDRRLLQHLSRISQKVISLFGKRDPLVGPVENNNIHFLFQLVDRVG